MEARFESLKKGAVGLPSRSPANVGASMVTDVYEGNRDNSTGNRDFFQSSPGRMHSGRLIGSHQQQPLLQSSSQLFSHLPESNLHQPQNVFSPAARVNLSPSPSGSPLYRLKLSRPHHSSRVIPSPTYADSSKSVVGSSAVGSTDRSLSQQHQETSNQESSNFFAYPRNETNDTDKGGNSLHNFDFKKDKIVDRVVILSSKVIHQGVAATLGTFGQDSYLSLEDIAQRTRHGDDPLHSLVAESTGATSDDDTRRRMDLPGYTENNFSSGDSCSGSNSSSSNKPASAYRAPSVVHGIVVLRAGMSGADVVSSTLQQLNLNLAPWLPRTMFSSLGERGQVASGLWSGPGSGSSQVKNSLTVITQH